MNPRRPIALMGALASMLGAFAMRNQEIRPEDTVGIKNRQDRLKIQMEKRAGIGGNRLLCQLSTTPSTVRKSRKRTIAARSRRLNAYLAQGKSRSLPNSLRV